MTRTRNEPEVEEVDEKNRHAPHVNPEHSGGIRTGNPQLDPGQAHKNRDKAPPAPRK
jgi:hypothetical protein